MDKNSEMVTRTCRGYPTLPRTDRQRDDGSFSKRAEQPDNSFSN